MVISLLVSSRPPSTSRKSRATRPPIEWQMKMSFAAESLNLNSDSTASRSRRDASWRAWRKKAAHAGARYSSLGRRRLDSNKPNGHQTRRIARRERRHGWVTSHPPSHPWAAGGEAVPVDEEESPRPGRPQQVSRCARSGHADLTSFDVRSVRVLLFMFASGEVSPGHPPDGQKSNVFGI